MTIGQRLKKLRTSSEIQISRKGLGITDGDATELLETLHASPGMPKFEWRTTSSLEAGLTPFGQETIYLWLKPVNNTLRELTQAINRVNATKFDNEYTVREKW